MQGIAEFNFPTFHRVAAQLRSEGHTVFNPAEKDIERAGGVDMSAGNIKGDVAMATLDHKFSLRDALADDAHFICKEAEAIYLLPGWELSKGAFAEWALARALGHHIIYANKEVSHVS